MSIAIEHILRCGLRRGFSRVQIIRFFVLRVPYRHEEPATQSHASNQMERHTVSVSRL